MKNIYLSELALARGHVTDAESLNYLSSILRSLLQVMAICALEVSRQATPVVNGELDVRRFVDRFAQPSDGLAVETLDYLIPIIRGSISRGYFSGWFEKSDTQGKPLATSLREWVEFRNGRPGHGVLDSSMTSEWASKTSSLIEEIITRAGDLLPVASPSGLIAHVGDSAYPIATPLLIDGKAIVVRGVVARKGIWRLRYQLLSWVCARESIVDLPPSTFFAQEDRIAERFKWRDVPRRGGNKLVLNNIPVRQTANFVGRRKELDKLTEWVRETGEWNTCLIYGDGGFGKTTLALEFFNGLLDGSLPDEPVLPYLISFYTAKRTKWTEEGLVHFRGISSAMEDGLRELMYAFHTALSREWFTLSGQSLIDRVTTELRTHKFTRDDVILIIDNTETLATSTSEAQDLADFLASVAKTVGRVVITSRRRELMAAVPIQVSQLSEADSLQLVQQLGKELGARAINQAGEPRLRRACVQLMHKPLLIDTLARYIARSGSGIDEGLNHILARTNDQLLEFLYEDAWERMDARAKDAFMVLVLLATPLDSKSVSDVCRETEVLHSEFLVSLEQTYFASIVDHGDTYDLEIVELAKKFFLKKKANLSSASSARIEGFAFLVDKSANDRFEIEKNYRQDRVADAFQSDYAKAAKVAFMKRDYSLANESFELALLEEPLNAALHERFASFLLRSLGKAATALEPAVRATQLAPESADAWLTLALVHYNLGGLKDGDHAIHMAQEFGKPTELCLLRKAIARYHFVKTDPAHLHAISLLKEAAGLIDISLRAPVSKDYYQRKNRAEAEKYAALVRGLLLRVSRKRSPSVLS